MLADPRPRVIAIMGPTASGKSAIALELAQGIDAEIVSVDSALVYRGLDVGSAKPSLAERTMVQHHVIDVCDPWRAYSAAAFANDARVALESILARRRLPILVGGTGLYFRALLDGLAPMPQADLDLRARIGADAKLRGWPALHATLAAADPLAAARIHAADAQRIQRALEVLYLTGKPISYWQAQTPVPTRPQWRVLKLVLAPRERTVLHERIARRFDAMLDAGFLNEVLTLRALPQLAQHPAPLQLPALRSVGYRQAWEHLDGESSQTLFRERAIAATRQLAKRQYTWLRGEDGVHWFDPRIDLAQIEAIVRGFLRAQ